MSFNQKLLTRTEEKVACFHCYEEKHVSRMCNKNLQRHTDRTHPGSKKMVITQDEIAKKELLLEEERINNEIEKMKRRQQELQREKAETIRKEEEARLRKEEETRLKLEEQARLQKEEEARLQKEEEARLQKEEEARLQKEEEVRLQKEEEARLQKEEEAILQKENEARRRNKEEERVQKENEAKLQSKNETKIEAQANIQLENHSFRQEEEAQLQKNQKSLQCSVGRRENKKLLLPDDPILLTKEANLDKVDSILHSEKSRPQKEDKRHQVHDEPMEIEVVSQKSRLDGDNNPTFKRQKVCNSCSKKELDEAKFATKSDVETLGREVKQLLSEVKEAIQRSSCNSDQPEHGNAQQRGTLIQSSTDTQSLISHAKSMEDLLRYAPDFEKTEHGLACKPCNQNDSNKRSSNLKYEFRGDDNYVKIKQHKEFSNLKRRVNEHLDAAKHIRSKSLEAINTKLDEQLLQDNYIAGMNCARNAYKCLKLHDSYAQYESEIQIDAAKGVKVGELNHSSNFANEMTDHFYETLQEQHKEVMQTPLPGTCKPRPFSIVSDKGTPNRSTLHIMGMISQMDEKLQPVLMDIVEARDGTGAGLAKDLYDSMKKYFTDEEIKQRMVGMSWDGQYFHCNVNKELMKILEVPDENKEFYAAQYDVSHLLELADKEARTKSEWVTDTYDTITTLNQKFSYGKQYMELAQQVESVNKEKAESEKATVFKRLKPFSSTRFATYTGGVIEAVRNDYEVLYNQLHANKDPMLSEISNAGFVLRLNGLRDMYETVGETSRNVQRPDVYSWHVDNSVETCSSKIDKMAESLRAEEFEPDNIHLKYFNQAVRELRDEGTFMGKPVTNNKQSTKTLRSHKEAELFQDTNLERKIKMVSEELAEHMQNFKHSFERRYENNKAPMCKIDKECFSIEKILNRPNDFIPPEFENCVNISQRVNYVSPEISYNDMQSEYQEFTKVVHDKAQKWSESYLDLPIDEVKVYDSLINSENDLKCCRNVGHLLTASTTRTHCEAITEGMGSVVGQQLANRKKLSTEKLSKEAYLAWNGPFPDKSSDKLLERSLDKKFKSRSEWHFYRKTKRVDKLKEYDVSKVVDRGSHKGGKIPF